ncbi:hypothetical protein J1605_010364 [Eschrichtius robustus]|uniref:Uncharacterized protein n=1 Tax=Eschrichtius robustus TaxID=9764 RepID=A0AB34GSM9_ESCRO|nr:hypothetical protein J1605_010364 [Eschrichtius robustus]
MGSATSWLCSIWGGWDGPSKTTSSTVKPRFGIWARAVETADVVCGKCSRGRMQKADGECSLPPSDGAPPPGSYPGPEPEPPGLRSGQAGEPLPSAPRRPPSLDHLPPPAQGFPCLESRKKKTTTSITKSHSRGRKGDETEPPQCLGVLSSSIEVISEFPPPGKCGDGEMPCHTYARILLRVSGDADVTSLEPSLCLYR